MLVHDVDHALQKLPSRASGLVKSDFSRQLFSEMTLLVSDGHRIGLDEKLWQNRERVTKLRDKRRRRNIDARLDTTEKLLGATDSVAQILLRQAVKEPRSSKV